MALVSKAGSSYCIRSDITRGRTGQNVAFGVVNNVEASIMKEKSVNFSSLSCKNARVVQFFPLETLGFRSKRRNSVIVAASPPTEDALIATEPLMKQDLVGYLASGCKSKEKWRFLKYQYCEVDIHTMMKSDCVPTNSFKFVTSSAVMSFIQSCELIKNANSTQVVSC